MIISSSSTIATSDGVDFSIPAKVAKKILMKNYMMKVNLEEWTVKCIKIIKIILFLLSDGI